jgi:hypothetical protein
MSQPLITSQTNGASSIPGQQHHPNNLSTAVKGMPFKPAQMTQGNDFAMARAVYYNNVKKNLDISVIQPANSTKNKWYGSSMGRTAGQQISAKGMNTVGKATTNTLSPQPFSFSGKDQTTVKTALVRCRGGGCVAPKKKGAV